MSRNKISCAALVLLGYALRVSSVVIFALTLKAFLIVLDPHAASKWINIVLDNYAVAFSFSDSPVYLVIFVLGASVFVQYLLNHVYLKRFLEVRREIVVQITNKPLASNGEYHKHVSLDLIPAGFESVIKIVEIALFYLSLLVVIFLISPLIGISVAALMSGILLFMFLCVSDRAAERQKAFQRKLTANQEGNLIEGLHFADHIFTANRKNTVYAEFFGGLGMVLIMLFYVLVMAGSGEVGTGATAIILVLSVRFLINYTSEFSRLLRVLIDQSSMLARLDLYSKRLVTMRENMLGSRS